MKQKQEGKIEVKLKLKKIAEMGDEGWRKGAATVCGRAITGCCVWPIGHNVGSPGCNRAVNIWSAALWTQTAGSI